MDWSQIIELFEPLIRTVKYVKETWLSRGNGKGIKRWGNSYFIRVSAEACDELCGQLGIKEPDLEEVLWDYILASSEGKPCLLFFNFVSGLNNMNNGGTRIAELVKA